MEPLGDAVAELYKVSGWWLRNFHVPAAALEQNKPPAVEPNEALPAAAAAEPNKMSPASSVEPDRAPAVELNDAQPAASAVEPNKMSAAPDTTVEPDSRRRLS